MPPKVSAHPKYEDMVKAAILALKDRNGSSVPAIAKYLAANYKLPDNFKKILSTQLKNLVKSGKLLKVKASYKLGEVSQEGSQEAQEESRAQEEEGGQEAQEEGGQEAQEGRQEGRQEAQESS